MNWIGQEERERNRDRYVLARVAEGASWPEIASEINVTRQRVRQIIHQARIRQAAIRRNASPVADFFYTERFGPKR